VATFELDGKTYQVARLKVRDSLAGLKLVGKVLLPAIAEGASAPKGHLGGAIAKAVEGLDCLPALLDLFVPVTKFTGPTGSLVDLSAFVEDAFGGRPDLCVEFIARAVQAEYSGFLAASGASGLLGKLMAKAAAASSSPTG
jgi:hypothetical protein